MIVLGVDVAQKSGWGLVEGGTGQPRLLSYGAVKATANDIVNLVGVIAPVQVDVAVLEDPYMHLNAATAIKLGRLVGRWEQELERTKIPVLLIKASSWQQHLLHRFIGAKSRREQRKAAAVKWVKLNYGVAVSQDEADAICMATCTVKTETFKRLSGNQLRVVPGTGHP